jgi:hypothetical protein
MRKSTTPEAAKKIKNDLQEKNAPTRIKIKSLLKAFGYKKRSDDNTTLITELLSNEGLDINPSLMRLGDKWNLTTEDWVYLSIKGEETVNPSSNFNFRPAYDWKQDSWFEEVLTKKFRTEREVETKFILPLLHRLGFSDDDRYDAMIINAAHGSRKTSLEVDFAVFNVSNELLKNQTLLVAEAKKEERLIKQVELENAQRQVKSYSLWLSCHFGLVTDSNRVQVLDLLPSFDGIKILFDCKRDQLSNKFAELYNLTSKEALTAYYEAKMR